MPAVPPPGAPACGPACPVAGVLVVDGGWAQAQPMSRPGRAACLHDSVRQAWAGVGRQWALSAAAVPQGGAASLAAALPARDVSSLPPHYPMPGWEQLLPASPRPQAHLLPGHPLSMLLTPDLWGVIFPLAGAAKRSLAGCVRSVQSESPTVLHIGVPIQDGVAGEQGGSSWEHCPMAGGLWVHIWSIGGHPVSQHRALSGGLLWWQGAPGIPGAR